jgi:hypothetical protein
MKLMTSAAPANVIASWRVTGLVIRLQPTNRPVFSVEFTAVTASGVRVSPGWRVLRESQRALMPSRVTLTLRAAASAWTAPRHRWSAGPDPDAGRP